MLRAVLLVAASLAYGFQQRHVTMSLGGWFKGLFKFPESAPPYMAPYTLPEATWRSKLSNEAFVVLRQAGTERPWTSPLNDVKSKGVFECAGCGASLFNSTAKFDSGTGWPSFFQPASKAAVVERTDYTLGMPRTEIICSNCGGHLGHSFPDGPRPTGLRYCINGVALKFKGDAPQSENLKSLL